ncbi:LPD38 domain-containing protein [Endozoicomonas sp. ALC013]|uniref:LPD38 domain-containing protein n=1 Tax=Endozoicomonas sp. ALC013 TaxID=3403076 RepID=UPI003BB5CC15
MNEVVGKDGKGMREFYDKRLANYMKKYTRKWGAKLEPIEMAFHQEKYPYDNKQDKVWSVTVTDKMRDSVLKDGQPLFSLKDDPQGWGKSHQALGARLGQKDQKPDNSPRYALKDIPDDVLSVIKDIHGGINPKSKLDRLKEQWDSRTLVEHIQRWQVEANQGILNRFAIVEHNEKQLNDGKLLDAALSASKAAYLSRNSDSVTEAVLFKGTPMLKDGSVIIKPNSQGIVEVFTPVAERGELETQEVWAGSIRARRIIDEDKAARAKGNQLLVRGQAMKETLDAIAPDEYQGGRSAWNRDRKQMEKDLKLGKDLNQQSSENLYDEQKINTIQNWVDTQPQLKARFNKVKDSYQAHNKDLLDFMEASGLLDKDVRKLFETDDYLPFHRVHDLEAKEQDGGRIKRGLSGQKSGIRKLTGGVEKIAPLEAMVRNTRAMIDAAFKNIAQQRIVEDGVRLGALDKVEAAFTMSDQEVVERLRDMELDTNLTPTQMRRWKALLSAYVEPGNGVVSVSVNGKLEYYQTKDPLLYAAIQDLGAPAHNAFEKLIGFPRKVLTTGVTSLPDFWLRNLFRDTLSTAVHIAPEVNDKPLKLNPVAGAVRGFRKSLKEDETRWALAMGGGMSGSGYYTINSDNVRKKLSPEERKRIINRPGQLWDLWKGFGSRFENANRLHVYERAIEQGGSTAEAAFQSLDVLNFTRSGQWPLIRFMVNSIPFFNSLLQGVNRLWRGVNRLWRGIKPGNTWDLSSFSGSVIFRGLLYGMAAWALMKHYEDDDRYKELTNDDKLGYHHFWIGEGKEGHYRIPKPFEVGAIFATLPEIITQSLDGHEDMKWTRDMMYGLVMNIFNLDPIPQIIKPIWEVSENRDRFRDRPILPMRLQDLKPEAQYDPYTSDTLKELVQWIPEEAPDWMRSPKKLEHLIRGYFGSLGSYTLMAADAMTRKATGAADKPTPTLQDNPLLGSFVRDKVTNRNRYTDELHEMTVDINEIANSIKRYQESGKVQRAKDQEQSAAAKLKHKAGLQKASREINKLRKEVRRVMEDRSMNSETKRQQLNTLHERINQLSMNAVKRYQQPFH